MSKAIRSKVIGPGRYMYTVLDDHIEVIPVAKDAKNGVFNCIDVIGLPNQKKFYLIDYGSGIRVMPVNESYVEPVDQE